MGISTVRFSSGMGEGMAQQNQNRSAALVADEVAAAEANLRAAQERLAAARQRYEQGAQMNQAFRSEAADKQFEQPQAGWQQQARASRDASYTPPTSSALPQKDHIAAGVFAILLGAFGIHKFYMGLTNAGFITLAISIVGSIISFGAAAVVMALVGIVEGIIYLAKPQSQFLQDYIVGKKAWF